MLTSERDLTHVKSQHAEQSTELDARQVICDRAPVPDPRTTERLLEAAWAEANEHGVADLTLANVAARAGVSRQAVYLHFANRAELLVAVAAWIDRRSGFRGRVRAARDHSPVDALVVLLDSWFDYLPTILPVALALEGAALTGTDGAAAYRDRMDDWHEGIGLALARVAEADGLAEGWTTTEAADWTWATVHPTHVHHFISERGWSMEVTRRRLLDAVLATVTAGRA